MVALDTHPPPISYNGSLVRTGEFGLNDFRFTQASTRPETEVINSLCGTIERQSALCSEMVRNAVEHEREQCAIVAEREAQSIREEGDSAAGQVANRIAQQ